jgi:hypothetical protein
MVLNQWKVGGKPTSYAPFSTAQTGGTYATASVTITKGNYTLRFRAKSASSARLRLTDDASNDFFTDITLTTAYVTYERSFTSTSVQLFYIQDYLDRRNDIYIDSIELVYTPLPSLTINGIDGFQSGKWTLPSGTTVISDSEIEVTTGSSSVQVNYPSFTGVTGTQYVFKTDSPAIGFQIGAFNQFTYATTNTACFTVGQMTSNTTVGLTFQVLANQTVRIKNPMLHLGTVPVPYNPKTGDQMVMPIAKKNLINIGGSFVNRSFTGVGAKWNVGGSASTRIMSDFLTPIKSNTSYILSGIPSGYAVALHQTDSSGTNIIDSGWLVSNYTFTAASNASYVVIYVRLNPDASGILPGDALKLVNLQLEQGTIQTTFSPYKFQAGKLPQKLVPRKNMIDVLELGNIDTSGLNVASTVTSRTANFIPVTPNTVYTISKAINEWSTVRGYDSNKTFIGILRDLKDTGGSFTTQSNCTYIRVAFNHTLDIALASSIQIEQGGKASMYEPYQLIPPKPKSGLDLNGNLMYVQNPINLGTIANNNIAIEMLVYLRSYPAGTLTPNFVTEVFNSSTIQFNMYIDSAKKLKVGFYNNGSYKQAIDTVDFPLNTWIKVKGTYDGSTIRVYYNDVLAYSAAINQSLPVGNGSGWRIGRRWDVATNADCIDGIFKYVRVWSNNVLTMDYDFTNTRNIVGSTFIPNSVNMIPSFEDSRWTIHPNASLLGGDMLHHVATGGWELNRFILNLPAGSTYLVNSALGQISIDSYDATNTKTVIKSAGTTPYTFIVPTGSQRIEYICSQGTAGTYDYSRPQLYLLNGNEGTIYGSPAQSEKPPLRLLYPIR